MKKPYLLGVEHRGENAIATIDALVKLGVKSVGLECPASLLAENPIDIFARYGTRSHQMYWSFVAMQLKERGITVEPLVPEEFDRRAKAIQRGGKWIHQVEKSNGLQSAGEILVYSTLARQLKESAHERKVEAIVCGAPHAFLLRTEMRVPKNQFMLIHTTAVPREAIIKFSLEKLRATRRFRRGQRDLRKPKRNH